MESWLSRLVGHFRIEGTYENSGGSNISVSGTANCTRIGAGAGVYCLISTSFKAPKESHKQPQTDKALYKVMSRLVVIYGMDPDSMTIRGAWVSDYAGVMSGVLSGDALMFDIGGGLSPDRMHVAFPSHISGLRPDLNLAMNGGLGPGAVLSWMGGLVTAEAGKTINMKFDVSSQTFLPAVRVSSAFDLNLHRESPDRP
jgi:hypothetical protein